MCRIRLATTNGWKVAAINSTTKESGCQTEKCGDFYELSAIMNFRRQQYYENAEVKSMSTEQGSSASIRLVLFNKEERTRRIQEIHDEALARYEGEKHAFMEFAPQGAQYKAFDPSAIPRPYDRINGLDLLGKAKHEDRRHFNSAGFSSLKRTAGPTSTATLAPFRRKRVLSHVQP